MLPRATNTRGAREAASGKQSGRTQEIQRLIGRSLRAVTDLAALGERQISIDCDVLQADGGTRCASITGAMVALADAVAWLRGKRLLAADPLRDFVAAVSVGIVDGEPVLDLDYAEDSGCDTDMNVVMTGAGRLRRGAGHRRGRAVHARADGRSCSTLARSAASRELIAAADATRRWTLSTEPREQGRHRVEQSRASCASLRALLEPLGIEVVAAGGLRRRRGRRAALHVPRERARQGAAREPRHGPAGARRRLGPLRAALGGEPGVHSAYYAGRDGEPRGARRAQQREARRAAARTRPTAGVLLLRARARAPRRRSRRRSSPRARGTARSCSSRAARTASATTRISSCEARGLTAASSPPREKNRVSHRGAGARRARALQSCSPALAWSLACRLAELPPLSLYVHIPWCVRKCPYCDFNSHEKRGDLPEDEYVDALVADLEASLPDVWGRRAAHDLHRRRHAEPLRARVDRPPAHRDAHAHARSIPTPRSRWKPIPARSRSSASAASARRA